MKKLLLAVLFAAMPSIAFAQNGYIEGAVGFTFFPDVETDNYSILLPSGQLFQGNAQTEYDANWALGAELGFGSGPWRFGASWDLIKAEVDAARVEGTLDGVPISRGLSDSELAGFGIDANNDMNVFAANGYYTFGSYNIGLASNVEPYVGLGAGVATFSGLSTEFALLLTLGARVALGSRAYLGARYRLTFVSGPEADSGIHFNEIKTHTI